MPRQRTRRHRPFARPERLDLAGNGRGEHPKPVLIQVWSVTGAINSKALQSRTPIVRVLPDCSRFLAVTPATRVSGLIQPG
jgi:hypothetical protein